MLACSAGLVLLCFLSVFLSSHFSVFISSRSKRFSSLSRIFVTKVMHACMRFIMQFLSIINCQIIVFSLSLSKLVIFCGFLPALVLSFINKKISCDFIDARINLFDFFVTKTNIFQPLHYVFSKNYCHILIFSIVVSHWLLLFP